MYTDEFARQRDAAAFCFVVALMGLVVLLLATPWLLAVCASVLLVVGYFVVEATPRIQREERRRGDRTGPARILPLWVEEIPPEKRPYGIVTTVGLSLPAHTDCVGCIASKLVEVVLRARAVDAERLLALAAQRDIPNIKPDETRIGLPTQTAAQRFAANERDERRS